MIIGPVDAGATVDGVVPRLAAEGVLPPTLIVSGYLDHESEAFLTGLGPVVGTLSKPFGLEELRAALDEALERAK